MFVINVSAVMAIATQIRATARGNGAIVIRDLDEPFQPASRRVGLLLTVSMLGKGVSHQNAPIVANQSLVLGTGDNKDGDLRKQAVLNRKSLHLSNLADSIRESCTSKVGIRIAAPKARYARPQRQGLKGSKW